MSTKKIIENAKRKGIILHDDHKLVTRRDFLGAGIIPFSAAIMAPTVLSVLVKSAMAEVSCPTATSSSSSLAPFIQLHLSGGSDCTQILPMKSDGNHPAVMDLLGKGSVATLNADANNTLAARTFLDVDRWFYLSSFLASLKTEISGASQSGAPNLTIQDKTTVIFIANQSRDDSGDNKMGLDGLVARAGLIGSNVNVIVGQGRGNLSAYTAPSSLLQVNSVLDLANAVGIAAPIGGTNGLNDAQKSSVFDLIKKLSDRRAAQLLTSNAAAIQTLTGCATQSNITAATAAVPITDASQVPSYQTIWGINAGTNAGDRNKVFASCAYNALTLNPTASARQAGFVNLKIGGYDYHDNTRTTGNQRDATAGQMIGKLIRSADASGSKLALLLTTDGCVRSAQSQTDLQAAWVSDRGQASGMYLFLYDPAARPALNSGTEPVSRMKNQIGYFTDGQSADMNYLGGKWSTETACLAILANYLKFSVPNNWHSIYTATADAAATAAGMANPLPGNSGAGVNPDLLKVLRVA